MQAPHQFRRWFMRQMLSRIGCQICCASAPHLGSARMTVAHAPAAVSPAVLDPTSNSMCPSEIPRPRGLLGLCHTHARSARDLLNRSPCQGKALALRQATPHTVHLRARPHAPARAKPLFWRAGIAGWPPGMAARRSGATRCNLVGTLWRAGLDNCRPAVEILPKCKGLRSQFLRV